MSQLTLNIPISAQLVLPFDPMSLQIITPRLKQWIDDRSFDAFGRFVADQTGLYRVSFDQLIRNSKQFGINTRRVQIDLKYYREWILFIQLDSFLGADFDEKVSSYYLGPKRRTFLKSCQVYAATPK